MAHFHNNDLEYVVDDPFEDDPFADDEPQANNDSEYIDSDFEDDLESVCVCLLSLFTNWFLSLFFCSFAYVGLE